MHVLCGQCLARPSRKAKKEHALLNFRSEMGCLKLPKLGQTRHNTQGGPHGNTYND